jgi:hypothetical protein
LHGVGAARDEIHVSAEAERVAGFGEEHADGPFDHRRERLVSVGGVDELPE